MFNVNNLAFYITNVCNLNCNHCNHFNNYPVKGHQKWQEYKENCIEWATKVQPFKIYIYGGEPMTNPDFLNWINGLAEIWTNCEIKISTNGTLFHKWPTLYDTLLQYKGRVRVSISGHNENYKEKELTLLKNFLKGRIKIEENEKSFQLWSWKTSYDKIKDVSWPDVNSIEDYELLPIEIKSEIETIHGVNIHTFIDYNEPVEDDFISYIDENGIKVGWANWTNFNESAITFNYETGKMTLNNSDPTEAVKMCHGGRCNLIKNGKLYKCAPMAVLPELIKQNFPLDITNEDKKLILDYQPASNDWEETKLKKFYLSCINKEAIPQCKFCPVYRTQEKIYATHKKIKIKKTNTVD